MPRVAVRIELTADERKVLEKNVNALKTPRRVYIRSRIVLLSAEGKECIEIAEILGINEKACRKWRKRFTEKRMEGLEDLSRSGAPDTFTMEDRLQIITLACNPPEVSSHWTLSDLTQAVIEKIGKSISYETVRQTLKMADLKPHQYKMWLNSTDPDFDVKQADIIGLYINPPENAVVYSVDEKTAIQANERKYPTIEMSPGHVEKVEHEYIRHGTQCLLAALNVHTGEVLGECYDTRKAPDFLDFMKTVDAEFIAKKENKGKEMHVVVDNLNIHSSPVLKEWLSGREYIKFHFTPKHASWLNQIELFFSIITRKLLKRGSFKSKENLAKKIIAFIEDYNKKAKPFAWTYKGRPLQI